VIVFLVFEQARWLTGQLLFVGNGHRISENCLLAVFASLNKNKEK